MHHVLVAGDDEDVVTDLGGLAGESANDVVGLKPDGFKNGNAESLERAANVRNLAREVFGHGSAISFVSFVTDIDEGLRLAVPAAQGAHGASALVAEDFAAYVEDGRAIERRKVLAKFFDHVDEDVNGGRWKAATRRHGAAPLHGVISAKDERHGVEKEYRRFGLIGHGSEFISHEAAGWSDSSVDRPPVASRFVVSHPFHDGAVKWMGHPHPGTLESGDLALSGDEHAVAVAEEAVFLADCMTIGGEDLFAAGEGADEHEQA